MKTERGRVSAAQFFTVMFLSDAALALFSGEKTLGGANPLEGVFSMLLAAPAGLLVALPLGALFRRFPDAPVYESFSGTARRVAAGAYGLWAVTVTGAFLGLFSIYLEDTVNPEFSSLLTVALILAASAYGAFRGMECVARCAGVVLAFFLLGAGLVFFSTVSRFRAENLMPLFYDGFSQTLWGAASLFARVSVFGDAAVLLPMVKKHRGRGFAGYALGLFFFCGVLFLLLAGCLGAYGSTQNFPVHALSALTQVRSMQRLDAVFVGAWIMALIVRGAASVMVGVKACRTFAPGAHSGAAALLSAGGMLLAALLTAESRYARRLLLNPWLLLFGVALTGGVLPLWALLRRRKGERP